MHSVTRLRREYCNGSASLPRLAQHSRELRPTGLTVAALVVAARDRRRIANALCRLGTVFFCRTRTELQELLFRERVTAVLTEPLDADLTRLDPLVRELKRHFPSLPVVVYADCTPSCGRDVVRLVRAGADEVVYRGIDDLDDSISDYLQRVVRESAAGELLSSVASLLGPLLPFFQYCLSHAHDGVSVASAARALGVDRKTLLNRATAAELPPPRHLLAWCRVLTVAAMLHDPGRTVEQVAGALGFGSTTALRRVVRRCGGLRVADLRGSGVDHRVADAFALELEAWRLRVSSSVASTSPASTEESLR